MSGQQASAVCSMRSIARSILRRRIERVVTFVADLIFMGHHAQDQTSLAWRHLPQKFVTSAEHASCIVFVAASTRDASLCATSLWAFTLVFRASIAGNPEAL